MATYGYQNTSYGAQGGAEGGGFMAGGGSQAGSQETPSKGYTRDSVRPVTIKQLVDAVHPHPDADFKIDGGDVTVITFVGQIRSISIQATNITYKLDDGTSLIEIKKWIDQDKAETSAPYSEGQYLRAYGRLKEFSSKRHVGAHAIRLIEDHNEVTFHLLEAAFVHLYFTRGPPETLVKTEGGGGGMFVEQNGGARNAGGNAGVAAAAANGLGAHQNRNMSSSARKVLTELNNAPQNNEGLHLRQIASSLGMGQQDVYKACDELLGMGIIYTTVDDETFAVLEY